MRTAFKVLGAITTVVGISALLAVTAAGGSRGPTSIPVGPGTTAAIGGPAAQPPPAGSRQLSGLALQVVVEGLELPVDAAVPPGSDELFIVERRGRVRILSNGELVAAPFLDVATDVESGGLEQGLLDLEFHPDYARNGRFYVHYTNRNADTRVLEFEVSLDPHRAHEGTPRLLLAVEQPHQYHNGGMLQFGPDGYLYVALGDGGGIGDSFENGQNPGTLLGALLRLDVDAARPYAIPPDNPFVDGGGSAEVWAYGLRNPWRFWIDPVEALIYITDVGHDLWEEVNVVPLGGGGHNFGWPIREGPECFQASSCADGFTDPVFAYPHRGTCSIIGGPVYRGSAIPELWGRLIYGDFCAGWIRSLRLDGGTVDDQELLTDVGFIQSFGVDGAGEVLVLTQEGTVYRIVPERSG